MWLYFTMEATLNKTNLGARKCELTWKFQGEFTFTFFS